MAWNLHSCNLCLRCCCSCKIKELAAQTVTQYAAIQAERAAAAQQVISTQTVVANTQATLAAIAAEKALEVQRLKSQITEKAEQRH